MGWPPAFPKPYHVTGMNVSWAKDLLATFILNLSAEAIFPSQRNSKRVHLTRQMGRAVDKLEELFATPTPRDTRAPAAPNTATAETPTHIVALAASPAVRHLLLHPPPLVRRPDPTVVAASRNLIERLAIPMVHSEGVALRMAIAERLTVIVVQAA